MGGFLLALNDLIISEVDSEIFVVQSKTFEKCVKMSARDVEILKKVSLLSDKNKSDVIEKHADYSIDKEYIENLIAIFERNHLCDFLDTVHEEKKDTKEFYRIVLHKFNVEKLAGILKKLDKALFSNKTSLLILAVIVFMNIPLFFNTITSTHDFQEINVWGYLIIFFLLIISLTAHELAHAVCCVHYGGEVKNMGIVLFFLFPTLFCDVTRTYMFKNKYHKVFVSLAGVACQLAMGSVVLLIYMLTGAEYLFLFYMMNLVVALFNMIPFLKLDGYWVVVHLTGVYNLNVKSRQMIFMFLSVAEKRKEIVKNFKYFTRKQKFIIFYGAFYIVAECAFWSYTLFYLSSFISFFLDNPYATYTGVLLSVLSLILVFMLGISNALKNKNTTIDSLVN